MYSMCLVYVFNVVNIVYISVFHVLISSLKYKAKNVDSKINCEHL